jgi:hypothetical protein
MWGPITAGSAVLLGVIVWLLISVGRNVKQINVGKTAIVVHGDGEQTTPLGRALAYVPNNVGQITSLIYTGYLRLMKEKGVSPDDMTGVEDAIYARMLIRFACAAGNGTNSVQKIIETDIANRDWDGEELTAYIRRSVVPRVLDSLKALINSEYDSIVRYAEHSDRARVVSQVEFVDMLLTDDFRDSLVDHLRPFYEYAHKCLSGVKR